MHNLSIFGTGSDAGKSTVTWLIGRILRAHGIHAAPFKAQNVSNNAHIADDGSEIAVAQYFQAQVMGVPTSWHNNPVLLKSGRNNAASLIVKGKHIADKDVWEYYRNLDILKPAVMEAFEYLDNEYDIVIAEGAGSPVELNLMHKDLSNIFIADTYDTKIILVADIEKGGVFAAIYGVYHLLPHKLRNNIVGVIINKFRGDMRFFDEGVRIIEKEFGIPVLGVLPYHPFNLGFEDSQSLMHYTQHCDKATRHIAVIAYPHMSNYTDFEPLLIDESVCVRFVCANESLAHYDCIILPGSKRVFEDLRWLKETGLFAQLQQHRQEKKIHLIGICGGYEMMHRRIIDNEGIEATASSEAEGLGFIEAEIHFKPQKIRKRNRDRYEIHHGISTTYPDGYRDEKLYGTFEHGIFIDEHFKKRARKLIERFTRTMTSHLDVERILKSVR